MTPPHPGHYSGYPRYKALEIDAICGLDARGFVLGPPIALGMKKPFFMMRKPGNAFAIG